ncbi:hypothetical protein ACU686_23605, partial [Yinghuangia aomiensis]
MTGPGERRGGALRRRAVPRRHHRPRGLRPRGHLRHLTSKAKATATAGAAPAEPGIRHHPVPGRDQGRYYGYDTPAYENSAYESPACGTPHGQQRYDPQQYAQAPSPFADLTPEPRATACETGYDSGAYAAPQPAQPGYAPPIRTTTPAPTPPTTARPTPASGVRPDAAPPASRPGGPGQEPPTAARRPPPRPPSRRSADPGQADPAESASTAGSYRVQVGGAGRRAPRPPRPAPAAAAPGCSCRPAHSGTAASRAAAQGAAGRPGRANWRTGRLRRRRVRAFVDERIRRSEDVIDWLKFAEDALRTPGRAPQATPRPRHGIAPRAGAGRRGHVGGAFACTTWFKGDAKAARRGGRRRRGADPQLRGKDGQALASAVLANDPSARHRLDDRAVGDHRQHPLGGPGPARRPDGGRRRRCVPGSARAALVGIKMDGSWVVQRARAARPRRHGRRYRARRRRGGRGPGRAGAGAARQ